MWYRHLKEREEKKEECDREETAHTEQASQDAAIMHRWRSISTKDNGLWNPRGPLRVE